MIRPLAAAGIGLAALIIAAPVLGNAHIPEAGGAEGGISVYGLADALVADGEAESACRLIEEVYGPDTPDIGALIRLANCSLALGRIDAGLGYLESASAQQPGNAALQEQVALLGAAVALADLSVALAAENRAASVPVAAPVAVPAPAPVPAPGAVQAAEQAHLAGLPGPQLGGRVGLQRLFNSNVNSGTYNDTFIGFGLPLVVAPGSKAQADWATRLSLDGSLTMPLDWLNAIRVNAGLSATLYDVLADRSRLDVFLSTAWITGTNQTGAELRPHADLGWVAGLYDRSSVGLEASGHHLIAPQTLLLGSVDITRRWQADAADTGWMFGGNAGVRQLLTPDMSIGANIGFERMDAASATRSYWRIGPEIYVSAALTDTLGLNLDAGVDFVSFDGSLPVFATERYDVRYRVGASLDWRLSQIAEGLVLCARYDFSHQQSNQDLFDNDRHLVAVSLSYEF